MSDPTVPINPVPTVVPKPDVEFLKETYGKGDLNGYTFIIPEYNNLDKLTLDYGVQAILDLANTSIAAKLRTKVKLDHELKKGETLDAFRARLKAKSPDGVLFTQEQATAWRPGTREKSANMLMKEAQELFSKGDVQGGLALLEKMKAKLLEDAGDAAPAPTV